MRLNNPLSTRPAYYDRTPVTKNGSASLSVPGGTGTTTAWSYTVPANRKAFIESSMVSKATTTAGSVASASSVAVTFTPSGGSASRLVAVEFDDLTLGGVNQMGIGSVGMIAAGDIVAGVYNNSNTGGSIDLQMHAKFTEFDS